MSLSKKVNLLLFLMIVIFSFTGCTTTYLDLKSWEGKHISDLYFERGKADEFGSAKHYYRVHTWFSRGKDGTENGCRQSFYTHNKGTDEVIVDTKYEGCHFMTLK